MKKLNKVLAVLIILILIAGWTITVGGAGDKVGSIKIISSLVWIFRAAFMSSWKRRRMRAVKN